MRNIFTRFLLVVFGASMLFSDAIAAVPAAASLPVVPSSMPANEPDPSTVKSAISEFRSLSRKERRTRLKEVRKALREYKHEQKAGRAPVAGKFLQVAFAILLPPLGVYLHEGEINKRFWIDLLLTLLFYVPGMVYALVVVLEK